MPLFAGHSFVELFLLLVALRFVPDRFDRSQEERLTKSGPELFRELKRVYSVAEALEMCAVNIERQQPSMGV